MQECSRMETASAARNVGDSVPSLGSIEFIPKPKSVPQKRRKFVLSTWAYGLFTAVMFFVGLILFVFFAYQALGGTGVLIAGSVIALGIFFFVKFILRFPG